MVLLLGVPRVNFGGSCHIWIIQKFSDAYNLLSFFPVVHTLIFLVLVMDIHHVLGFG